jgi:hypothetical protein
MNSSIGNIKNYTFNEVITIINRILDVEVKIIFFFHTLVYITKAEEKFGFKRRNNKNNYLLQNFLEST